MRFTDERGNPNVMKIAAIGAAAFMVLVALMMFWPLRSVPTGSRGVITVGGAIRGIESEGYLLLAPWPAVGQVWQSQHSGNSFRVERVRISDEGSSDVSVQYQRRDDPSWNPVPMTYAIDLSEWRANLRRERRILLGIGQPPFSIHRPRPGAWPPPPPVSSTAPRRERQIMEGEIALTKPQLQAALQTWEQQSRDGKWPARPDLSVEQVAAESADHLWGLLVGVPAT